MDQRENRKYQIPVSITVSRDGERILDVKYTEDGTWDEYRKMCRWILQLHGLNELAEQIPR